MTYKTGRRAAKQAPALKLADVLTGVLPDHPAAQDNFTPLNGGWNMLGNDQYGTCVSVTAANVRRLMTKGAQYATLDQVIAFYKTQNPNFPSDDNGMDIQSALEELVKNGDKYFDGAKPVAFAKVDYTNSEEVKAAISIFGYVWTGVNVYTSNMVQFDAGQPWDYDPTSSLDGGHSVVTGGYDGDGVGGDERFITWGQETSFTDNFWSHCVEEAWVVIWPEHLTTTQFQQGVDVAKLAQAYQEITGRTLPLPTPPAPPTPTPVPVPPAPTPEPPAPTPVPPAPNPDPSPPPVPPAPEPTPTPTPVVDQDDLLLWNSVKDWSAVCHTGKNKKAARAVRTWAKTKGLL